MHGEYARFDALDLGRLIRTREISPSELVGVSG